MLWKFVGAGERGLRIGRRRGELVGRERRGRESS
jgi:hypothetical protein